MPDLLSGIRMSMTEGVKSQRGVGIESQGASESERVVPFLDPLASSASVPKRETRAVNPKVKFASCRQCGAPLPPRKPGPGRNRHFCSRECYRRSLSTRKVTNCEVCGAPIGGSAQRYCSRACGRRATAITKDCRQCGKTFSCQPWESRLVCSRKCARVKPPDPCVICGAPAVSTSGKRKSSKNGLICCTNPECWYKARLLAVEGRRVEVVCVVCGETASVPTSTGKNVARYCSKACRDKAWAKTRALTRFPPKTERECVECGTIFLTSRKGRRCCSKACANRLQRRDRQYKKRSTRHPQERGIGIRSLIRRDKGICGICGMAVTREKAPAPLSPSIDHVIPLAKGGTHTWDNVQLAHFQCNSLKSDTLTEDLYFKGEAPLRMLRRNVPESAECSTGCGATVHRERGQGYVRKYCWGCRKKNKRKSEGRAA